MSSVATADAPATSKAKAPKKPRAHPTYHEMIKEAIVALKERTGSSQIAIAKFIEEKQRPNLPANFKKLLLVQLKKLVANGKLVKVKNSFKLPPKSPSAAADGKKPAKTPAKTSAGDAKKKAKAPEPKPKGKAAEATGAEKKSAPVKRKATEPAKPKATKAAKTAATKSPGKKAAAAEKRTKKAPKSIKSPVKKPKSIKSPAKRAAGAKKAKK